MLSLPHDFPTRTPLIASSNFLDPSSIDNQYNLSSQTGVFLVLYPAEPESRSRQSSLKIKILVGVTQSTVLICDISVITFCISFSHEMRAIPAVSTLPASPTRSIPTTLVFHWKAAALHTTLLGMAVVWLFFTLDGYPGTFAPDHLQAYIRIACIAPLLGFCFSAISVHRLIPRGITFGAVLLGTALALWTDFAAASLYYGMISGASLEWLRTSLMVLTTVAVVIIALSNARHGYRTSQRELAAAERDVLTGLLNRAGLLRWYARLTSDQPGTLVVFDLNGLKLLNDTSGHGAGDAHIQSVGQAIRTALTGIGRVGRWGGDEFVAVIPNLPEAEVIRTIDTLLRQTSAESSFPAFAYGISPLNTGEPLERPFALADQRMYERKELQRDIRTQYTREINAVEEVSRALELLRTSGDLLTQGLPLIASLLRFDAVFYMERTADRWVITKLHTPDGIGTDAPLPIAEGTSHQLHQGVAGRALREGHTVYSTDYPSDPGASPVWVEGGLKTVLATPVRCFGEIVGLIYLASFST
ncbi:diguanylate cyclase domain-containing protein [Deinococcus altitudinis]|uniref:diguanylate cyclase domain-containing protein n=1 Tax=Deinococcus altitudinis TaxID=468914 RepID=UPI0038913FEB